MIIKTTMRTLRGRAGLSQSQLAEKMSKTSSAISKWDQGIAFPRLYPTQLRLLADSLKCSFEDLEEAEENWREEVNRSK